ncbi:hypothetical protein CK203_034871 [Vitis vinifera]|uniref:Uncharacterized protein n=1 Tax=Vitis vinifera TaxID=29760 RepID=A0A438FYL7_VITVI|nr:hypothetical protein CK203_034871 [Vitis vinifera]
MEKLYSVFLYVLLISLLFFPLTSAGRVLLDKPQKADDESGKHSNGGNKIGVEGSHSSQRTLPQAIRLPSTQPPPVPISL